MRELAERTLVLGLGGNVGGDDAVLARMRRVVEAVAAWGPVAVSSVYRTAAVGGPPQPAFLNAAVRIAVEPAPTPAELIASVQELERLLGRDRDREVRWGPRPIDVDVLLWGPRRVDWPGPPRLEVPHPRLAERRFALAPAIDVVGDDAVLPGDRRTLGAIYAALPAAAVELTGRRLD